MYDDVGHILYHVLIVLFPILIYYLIVIQDYRRSIVKRHNTWLFGMIVMILLLTITFPVGYASHFSYDFRVIPIFLAYLYLGFFQGIIVTIIALAYLFLLGHSGVFFLIINYAIITFIFYLILKKYASLSIFRKLLVISTLFSMILITRAFTLINNNEFEQFLIMFVFSLITWGTLLIVVVILENLKQQILFQQELWYSEKLNVISQLAASVAHEVRNPLTTVKGFLQLLSQDDNITEKQVNYIEISLTELNRAQSIINDYLSLAKPNNSSTQIVNISEELSKTVELMTSYSNIQNIEVNTAIEDSLYINGSKDEIKQVFINIIKNAIEAIGTEGQLQINASKQNEDVVISIIDNGIGMTAEQLSKIGTPFYSTKDIGTGIGLTICFQIVEKLKGTILVESTPGEGTTFKIKLPYCSKSK